MGPDSSWEGESARVGAQNQVSNPASIPAPSGRNRVASCFIDSAFCRLVGLTRTRAYTVPDSDIRRRGGSASHVEKRRAHRVRVSLSARYQSETVWLDGHVSDLSCDGLFLRSEFLDDAGTTVDVDLELPGTAQPIRLRGRVVRTDSSPTSCGMGIRFNQLHTPARLQLANYMLLRTSRAFQ